MQTKKLSILISGGGTGGHIFPALSIGEVFRSQHDADVLFVGANGKMEMERIPQAGFEIIGLPIRGYQRGKLLANLGLPIRILRSFIQSALLLRRRKPDAVIGVGGYASFPLLLMAQWLGYKTYLQEQNSFAGLSNRILGKRVRRAFVAFPGMEKFFHRGLIINAGNPIRKGLENIQHLKAEALSYFGLSSDKSVLLVTGGSLGARAINQFMERSLPLLVEEGYQVIWQTGKTFSSSHVDSGLSGVWIRPFIDRMELAYSAADVVLSRAGASTLSELAVVRKASVLIPSPNVTDDHQTHNARSLADAGAARMIKEGELETKLLQSLLTLLGDASLRQELETRLALFDKRSAAEDIVNEILRDIR